MAFLRNILLALTALLLLPTAAAAQDWTAGQQTITYSTGHPLGDGVTNTRGGEAPYFASEPADIPTDPTLKSLWTVACSSSDLGTTCGEFHDAANGGVETKARFDCNDAFDEPSDPILKPGEKLTNAHDHHFFGNIAAQGNMDVVNYAWLRTHGNSTCYGGPMQRTLYWEPTIYSTVNGVKVSKKAINIITYYVCGSMTEGPQCTRWPRGLAMIFGFDMNDPTNTRLTNQIATATAAGAGPSSLSSQPGYVKGNGFGGWTCQYPATPSYTTYSPNQVQGASQPYLNDGAGHSTMNCLDNTDAGVPTVGGLPHGIQIRADVISPDCWDGKNPRSPGGRNHLAYMMGFSDGQMHCPDGWYRIPHFQAKPLFVFKDTTEIANAYLSSDRMVGMTQFKGGESMHADLIPAWDYGTGDSPGFMVNFFQHCLGLSMHLKNSDGTTYTDLTGDPHECGYGRMSATTETINNIASPDGSSPNPVVNLNPDMTGKGGYFPISKGTALPGAVLHQTH